MNKLEKARITIEKIDQEMAKLFEERMEAIEEVVAYKVENNIPVLDVSREKSLIKKNLTYIKEEQYKESYLELFHSMLKVSKDYQKSIINKDRIGYGGTKGAFSHIAAMKLFPNHRLIAYTTFEEVVKAVEQGDLEYGVIPFENSATGEVAETSELLKNHNVYIQEAYDLAITQNLLGIPGTKIKDIKEVYSHPQAFSQSDLFLNGREWSKISYPNTALAAEFVSNSQDKSKAAIGSIETAKIFDLEVLVETINTADDNTTRFIVISKHMKTKGDYFQILFKVKNESGALAKAMNAIADYGYNMQSIKSRAILNEPWSYYFHVEIVGNLEEDKAKEMLEELKKQCIEIKMLGAYKKREE